MQKSFSESELTEQVMALRDADFKVPEIAAKLGIAQNKVSDIISERIRDIDEEALTAQRVKVRKPEVTEFFDHEHHKILYDYTDYMIDRPCECKPPEWKFDYESSGKVFYGLYYDTPRPLVVKPLSDSERSRLLAD